MSVVHRNEESVNPFLLLSCFPNYHRGDKETKNKLQAGNDEKVSAPAGVRTPASVRNRIIYALNRGIGEDRQLAILHDCIMSLCGYEVKTKSFNNS